MRMGVKRFFSLLVRDLAGRCVFDTDTDFDAQVLFIHGTGLYINIMLRGKCTIHYLCISSFVCLIGFSQPGWWRGSKL